MVEYLEKVVELRKQGKSYSEVSKVVGISKSWVGALLQSYRPDLAGRGISEGQLNLEVIQEPDELIGLKISRKVSRVGGIRSGNSRLRPKSEGVNLSRRRRVLVKKLWGENKVPGSNLPNWLVENVLSKLETDHQKKVFSNFYLLPIDEALSSKAKNDPDKTFRSWIITNLLPEIIKPFNIKNLMEQGVIKYARKHTSNLESNRN